MMEPTPTLQPRVPIRIFRADNMQYTPFSSDQLPGAFSRAGIEYVSHPRSAHIILSRFAAALRQFGAFSARFAVWTNEPRFDMHIVSPVRTPGVGHTVHIMNVYTGVYADNYQGIWHRPAIDRDISLKAFAEKPYRGVMLATYFPAGGRQGPPLAKGDPRQSLEPKPDGQLLRSGQNIDLTQRRQALALHLQRQGFCDIYGRGWPETVKINGESRFDRWVTTKQEILKDYAINLAFENTIAPSYVTEKIWDAIRGACLPVYHGKGTGIYGDLPSDSFIEAAGKTNAALGKEVMSMGRREAADRYETCLDIYHRILREERPEQSAAAMLARTVEFIQAVMQSPSDRP